MTTARKHACPGCGAPVDEGARRCPHCDTPIATVRCARCFSMNVPAALHCSGCGGELGLEPIGESAELVCPDCKVALSAFKSEAGTLFDCPRCGGQLVEHSALRAMLAQLEIRGEAALGASPRASAVPGPVRYLPCPVCGASMNRKNFGRLSGVIVDVCRTDGIWFDAGELARVMAFVAAGGLTRAREREADEIAQSKRDAAAKALATASMPAMSSHDAEDHHEASLVAILFDLMR
jgi:Zn-finger nucleic acid-binding protein